MTADSKTARPPMGPLAIAIGHVEGRWIPPAPGVASTVREKIIQNYYRSSPADLLPDITQDIALFTHCYRLVTQECAISHNSAAKPPLTILRSAPHEVLVGIVNSAPQKLDFILPTRSSSAQTATLELAAVGAHIAQHIALKRGFEGDAAYSLSLLRSLGLALIAWNYPTVFNRTVNSLRGSSSLEHALSRMLGFSPALLGYTVANQWILSTSVNDGLADVVGKPPASSETTELLKICRIGEALCRTNAPWHQPNGASRYIHAVEELEQMLGRTAIDDLKMTLAQHCSLLKNSLPDFLRENDQTGTGDLQVNNLNSAIGLTFKSEDIAEAPPPPPTRFQEAARKIEAAIASGVRGEEILQLIQSVAFPHSGFRRGCVYLLDPVEQTLLPRLIFGHSTLKNFDSVKLDSTKPAARALKMREPIFTAAIQESTNQDSTLSGCLGILRPIGVMTLDIKNESLPTRSHAMASFELLRSLVERSFDSVDK